MSFCERLLLYRNPASLKPLHKCVFAANEPRAVTRTSTRCVRSALIVPDSCKHRLNPSLKVWLRVCAPET